MRAFLFIFLSITLTLNSVKGQTYFNKEYTNDSSNSNLGSVIIEQPDTSGYLIIGSFSIPGYKGYLKFTRINTLGDTLWNVYYRNRPLAQGLTNGNFISLKDSAYVFPGVYSPQTSDSMQVNLFKIDTAGNVLWDYIYGDAGRQPPL